MIVHSYCAKCAQPYTIMLEATDLGLVKQISTEDGQSVPCPRQCGEMISLAGDQREIPKTDKNPLALNGKQLYQAVNGTGLPDELPVSLKALNDALVGKTIHGVRTEKMGKDFYLHELLLRDGTTVHLTAGQRGSKVLKVTKTKRKK